MPICKYCSTYFTLHFSLHWLAVWSQLVEYEVPHRFLENLCTHAPNTSVGLETRTIGLSHFKIHNLKDERRVRTSCPFITVYLCVRSWWNVVLQVKLSLSSGRTHFQLLVKHYPLTSIWMIRAYVQYLMERSIEQGQTFYERCELICNSTFLFIR